MNYRCNKALFLDLDGTIITTKSGKEFPEDEYDWKFLPAILGEIRRWSDNGYIICIVTNQGGIEMGYTTNEIITNKIATISKEIESYIGAAVNSVYCPNLDGYHRKPFPGMAYTLAIQLELDLALSVMVGDSKSDEGFATSAGIGNFMYVTDFTKYYK